MVEDNCEIENPGQFRDAMIFYNRSSLAVEKIFYMSSIVPFRKRKIRKRKAEKTLRMLPDDITGYVALLNYLGCGSQARELYKSFNELRDYAGLEQQGLDFLFD